MNKEDFESPFDNDENNSTNEVSNLSSAKPTLSGREAGETEVGENSGKNGGGTKSNLSSKPSEKPQVYSHSKLSTFEQCKLKYKFRYIDKIKPEIEGSIESHLGSSVHSTLEWLYKKVKQNKNQVPSIDEVIQIYIQNWEKGYSEKLVIVKAISPKEYFNKGLKFLLDYYTKHTPFGDNTLDLEKRIVIELDEQGRYKIQGFIDRLVHNLKTGEYEIHDYKTAGTLPSQEKFDTDRQLALYSLGVKEIFGKDKEVKLIWHYLAFNKKVESKRTDYQLDLLKKETIQLIKEIESTTEFPPKKSALCDWCEYKPICPIWATKDEIKFEKELIDESNENNKDESYPKKESNKDLSYF